MLKISIIFAAENAAVLRLEGHLAGAWIAELRDTCAGLRGRALTLNLAEVSLIERAGFDLLAELVEEGAAITGASPFQTAQLAAKAASLP